MLFNIDIFSKQIAQQLIEADDTTQYMRQVRNMPDHVFYAHREEILDDETDGVISAVKNVLVSFVSSKQLDEKGLTEGKNVNLGTRIVRELVQHVAMKTGLMIICKAPAGKSDVKGEPLTGPLKSEAIIVERIPAAAKSEQQQLKVNASLEPAQSAASACDKTADPAGLVVGGSAINTAISMPSDFSTTFDFSSTVEEVATLSDSDSDESVSTVTQKTVKRKAHEHSDVVKPAKISKNDDEKKTTKKPAISIKSSETVQQVLEKEGNDIEELKKHFKEFQLFAVKLNTYATAARMQFLNFLEEDANSILEGKSPHPYFPLNIGQLNKNIKRKPGRPLKNKEQN